MEKVKDWKPGVGFTTGTIRPRGAGGSQFSDVQKKPLQHERIEDVGSGFAKERQYAEYSNRDGTPCRIQDDSLMSVM